MINNDTSIKLPQASEVSSNILSESLSLLPTSNKNSYNLRQGAEELGIDRATLRSWIKRGKVTYSSLPSGRIRISKDEIERLKQLLNGEPDNTKPLKSP